MQVDLHIRCDHPKLKAKTTVDPSSSLSSVLHQCRAVLAEEASSRIDLSMHSVHLVRFGSAEVQLLDENTETGSLSFQHIVPNLSSSSTTIVFACPLSALETSPSSSSAPGTSGLDGCWTQLAQLNDAERETLLAQMESDFKVVSQVSFAQACESDVAAFLKRDSLAVRSEV